jgi:hypothetical protein
MKDFGHWRCSFNHIRVYQYCTLHHSLCVTSWLHSKLRDRYHNNMLQCGIQVCLHTCAWHMYMLLHVHVRSVCTCTCMCMIFYSVDEHTRCSSRGEKAFQCMQLRFPVTWHLHVRVVYGHINNSHWTVDILARRVRVHSHSRIHVVVTCIIMTLIGVHEI